MPLRTDFNTYYLDSENITVRSGRSRIPGPDELQNEYNVTVSTGYVYPATTQETALRESRILAARGAGRQFEVAAQTFSTPDGSPFNIAQITKAISIVPTVDDRKTGSWTTRQSIDVTANINYRDRCTLTASQAFTTSLSVAMSTALANPNSVWMLIMPIGNSAAGEYYTFNNTASITRIITSSCLVVAVAYKRPLSAVDIPQANWAIYHKNS